MKYLLLLFSCLFSINLLAQLQITGVVKNEDGNPIQAAKVYIDGSTYSTFTNVNGEFLLNLPIRNYQLIVTKEFYDNSFITINSSTKYPLQITLEVENINLQETVVSPISKEDRKYYLSLFKQYFLGREIAAKHCKILNEDDIRFNYDKNERILKASARKPLILKNNYLGYEVEYDLIDFDLNFKTNYVLVIGTSNFKEIKGNQSTINKWNKNRKEAYLGSVEHFVKSVYENKIQENGFELKRLIRQENPAYIKYKEELDNSLVKTFNGPVPPKIITYLINQPVLIDSIRMQKNDQKFLDFDGFYSVEFKKAKEDLEFVQKYRKISLVGNQLSIFSLNQPLQIFPDGSYQNPEDIIVEEYWSFKKIADLLPLDYIMSE